MSGDNALRINSNSYRDAVSITPADSDIDHVSALYIGGAGNVAVIAVGGGEVTFNSVPAGTILPIACTQVKSTGTSATNIVGLK